MRYDYRLRDGNPAGGFATGTGVDIRWQDGPVEGMPNGASVEDVIEAVRHRLEFFQTAAEGKFASDYNAKAIDLLDQARDKLDERTREREARGVEGSYAV